MGAHDPPKDPELRLAVIQDEIKALLKGHGDEIEGTTIDKAKPWFQRVEILILEYKAVKEGLLKTLETDHEDILQRLRWYERDPESKQEMEKKAAAIKDKVNALNILTGD